MTCEERLSHAIHIDKIKIFPNSSAIIEKSKVRHIQESHEDRVELKHVYNPYTLKYETKNIHLAHDFKDSHTRSQANKDQTWYFVLADCKGTLEVLQDEVTKQDHLLGLHSLWQLVKEDDYNGYEEMTGTIAESLKRLGEGNIAEDSFLETNLMLGNI
jgi:hypothetical protein